MRIAFAIATISLLSACGSSDSGQQFRSLGNGDLVMLISPDAAAEDLLAAAKAECGSQAMCAVHGWKDHSKAPAAFPFTDSEVASQSFTYFINRSTGAERALWNCQHYPRKSKDECMASE